MEKIVVVDGVDGSEVVMGCIGQVARRHGRRW